LHLPAHIILNGLVLGRGRWRGAWLAITAGAIFPDIPMLIFYGYQRLFLGRSEYLIWSSDYFQRQWQYGFDLFHSIPLIAAAALIAWRAHKSLWLVFFLSMLLHVAGDLPLHHDDAHAHFLPFSNWRYLSPFSYWDAQYYGRYFAVAEVALVFIGALILTVRSMQWRVLALSAVGLYAGLLVVIWTVWM
jgi:hypothetical protein